MSNGIKILGFAVLALVVMQLFPVDRSNPPEDGPLVIEDAAVAALVDDACADCHTHSTTWPWYGRVAPVSWWLVGHVEEGREHLNLSTWSRLTSDEQDHKLEEWIEMVEDGEMPLRSYTLAHGEARLSDQQRRLLVDWARGARADLGVASGEEQEHEDEEGH